MNNIQPKNIGISDFKSLIHSIKDNYYIDFSDYSLSSLKRRVELFLPKYHLNNSDALVSKLIGDKKFFQLFLKTILVNTNEMFRDHEYWNELKKIIVNKSTKNPELKFWFPYCNSGEELYSLLILLDKLNLIESSLVHVSSLSLLNVDRINEASLEIKSIEANSANLERTEIEGDLNDYFNLKSYYADLNKNLFQNTNVIHHDIFSEDVTGKFDFILFRNKMLYFNKQLSNKILIKLKDTLKTGGYFSVGVKEKLNYPGYERDFSKVCDNEKIYKKI